MKIEGKQFQYYNKPLFHNYLLFFIFNLFQKVFQNFPILLNACKKRHFMFLWCHVHSRYLYLLLYFYLVMRALYFNYGYEYTYSHKLTSNNHSFRWYLCIIIVLDLLIFISAFLNFCPIMDYCDAFLNWLRHGVQSKARVASWVLNRYLLNVWYVSSTVLHTGGLSVQSWYSWVEKITIKQCLIYNVLSALWVLQVMKEIIAKSD